MIYFDNAATTRIHPEVYEEMVPYLTENFGNPTSKYYELALSSNRAIKKAEDTISKCLGIEKDEIIFTSGSTESNNMIIKGIAFKNLDTKGHFITSRAEHSSVLEVYDYLETLGFEVTYLKVNSNGQIDVNELVNEIKPSTLLISIIWANNETGSLNNISLISDVCIKYNIPFHTDATQAIGKIRIDLSDYPGLKFLSASGHKIHGPKGIGISVIRKDNDGISTSLTPLIHGGGQQRNYRSGTLPVHQIVGLGKAFEMADTNLNTNIQHLQQLESVFIENLSSNFGELIRFNINTKDKVPGIISVNFKGIHNELLLKKISHEIAASTGSACSISKPSHVLAAMGYDETQIRNTIRFSFSIYNSIEDIETFIELLKS